MEWLLYLLKVSACTALFYALYHFFLKELTFFNFNRFYLLSTLIVSFLIPGLQLEIERQIVVPQEIHSPASSVLVGAVESEIAGNGQMTVVAKETPIYSWIDILSSIYWLIVAVVFIMFVYQIVSLFWYINKVGWVTGRVMMVYKSQGFTNCSFLNYIFVDEEGLTEAEIQAIIHHESVHSSKYHSLDKIFISICKALVWFNPFVYLFGKALEQVHEYQADREASSLMGHTSYANLLLNMVVRNNKSPLLHSFVSHPLKSRIQMLFTNQSKNMKKSMYLLTVPVFLVLGWLFAVQIVYAEVPEKTNRMVNQKSSSVSSNHFIEVKNTLFAGTRNPGLIITVKSPNGKQLKTGGTPDLSVKFFINGKVYTLEEAMAFSPAFIKSLSSRQGGGFGRQYDETGIAEKDHVFWFGKEPKLKDEEVKDRLAEKTYAGKTISGKVEGYAYMANNTTMNGFFVRLNSGEKIIAFVATESAVQVNKYLKIGDEIKIKAFNAFFSKRYDCVGVGSGTYSKDNKAFFDRNKLMIDSDNEVFH